MDPLTIGALVSGGVSLVKGIFGGAQGLSANKKINNLRSNRPTYTRPDEVNQMMDVYRKAAGRSQLPGQDLMEEKLGRSTAAGVRQVGKYASSSSSALGAITDIYGKEQDAIRDLGIQFASYKDAAERQLAVGYGQAAQYSDREFEINKMRPWETRMNELQSQKQAGAENFWGGVTGAASTALDFAGTKYFSDTMAGMYGAGAGTNVVKQNFSPIMPSSVRLGQDSLTNTLSGMRGSIKY